MSHSPLIFGCGLTLAIFRPMGMPRCPTRFQREVSVLVGGTRPVADKQTLTIFCPIWRALGKCNGPWYSGYLYHACISAEGAIWQSGAVRFIECEPCP